MFFTLTIWHQLHWNMICKPMNNYRSAKKGCRKAAFVSDIWLEAVAIYSCYFNSYSSWCVVFFFFMHFFPLPRAWFITPRPVICYWYSVLAWLKSATNVFHLTTLCTFCTEPLREEIITLQDILALWQRSCKNKARNLAKFYPFFTGINWSIEIILSP